MYTIMTPEETAKWENVCEVEKAAADAHYAALMKVLKATVPAEFLPTGEGFAISSTRHPGFSADHRLCSFYLDMGPDTMSTVVQFKFKKKTGRWALQSFTCSNAPPPFGIQISVRRFDAAQCRLPCVDDATVLLESFRIGIAVGVHLCHHLNTLIRHVDTLLGKMGEAGGERSLVFNTHCDSL